MALVPVRCPGCGASVELEEGQSVATCAYCGETSLLPGPRPVAEPSASATTPSATRASGPSRAGRVFWLIVALAVLGLGSWAAYASGLGLSFIEGGPSVRAFLVDHFGEDARFVKIQLQESELYAEAIGPDGAVVRHAFDGRRPRSNTTTPARRAEARLGEPGL